MEPSREELEAVAQTLKKVVVSSQIKLAWGSVQRQVIKDQLSKGVDPGGYRVEWLYDTRSAIIKTLAAQAERFNDTYKHDLISIQDMIDALLSAIHQLEGAAKRSSKEPGPNDA